MRGHEALIAMRRRGMVPAMVFLHDEFPFDCRDWQERPESIAHAVIHFEPDDRPARADLRFVVGLMVLVSFHDAARMRATVLACEAAGAKRVVGTAIRHIRHDLYETLAAIDTSGDQSWRN